MTLQQKLKSADRLAGDIELKLGTMRGADRVRVEFRQLRQAIKEAIDYATTEKRRAN